MAKKRKKTLISSKRATRISIQNRNVSVKSYLREGRVVRAHTRGGSVLAKARRARVLGNVALQKSRHFDRMQRPTQAAKYRKLYSGLNAKANELYAKAEEKRNTGRAIFKRF